MGQGRFGVNELFVNKSLQPALGTLSSEFPVRKQTLRGAPSSANNVLADVLHPGTFVPSVLVARVATKIPEIR